MHVYVYVNVYVYVHVHVYVCTCVCVHLGGMGAEAEVGLSREAQRRDQLPLERDEEMRSVGTRPAARSARGRARAQMVAQPQGRSDVAAGVPGVRTAAGWMPGATGWVTWTWTWGCTPGAWGLQRGCMWLQRGGMWLQRGCNVAAGVHERGEQSRVRRRGGVAEERGQQRAGVEEEGALAGRCELWLPLADCAESRLQLAHLRGGG